MTNRELRAISLGDPPPPADEPPSMPPRTATEAEALEELTIAVRNIYILCGRAFRDDPNYGANGLSQYDGGDAGYDRWGNRRPAAAIWPRLASHIMSIGADPFVYIQAQFQFSTRDRIPPPNVMFSDQAVANYQTHEHSAMLDLRNKRNQDQLSIDACVLPLMSELKWEESRAVRHALLNVSAVTASPLFRTCVASQRGFRDIVDRFYTRAVLQYVFRRQAYEQAWGDIIPPDVRSDGDSLRRTTCGRP